MLHRLLRAFTGELLDTTNNTDKLLAGAGAILGVGLVILFTRELAGPAQSLALVSMGATAVLLFAVPHGALSQPWPVLGGHGSAALIGVTCNLYIPDPLLGASLAVALSVMAMHYLRCIHPPGGATALFAVLGGPRGDAIGFGFVLHPVLSSVLVMLAVAVVFNYPFVWRRYPAALHGRKKQDPLGSAAGIGLSSADLEHAMREMNVYIDMTEEDLARLYLLAKRHHVDTAGLDAEEICVGRCYSNGRVGAEWSVRKVLDEDGSGPADRVIYRVVGGDAASNTETCTRAAFARWARYPIASEGRVCETAFERLQAANTPVPLKAASPPSGRSR